MWTYFVIAPLVGTLLLWLRLWHSLKRDDGKVGQVGHIVAMEIILTFFLPTALLWLGSGVTAGVLFFST
jgi:hypothetical protein